MQALPHQELKAKTILRKLRLYGLCIFAGEIRSGKSAAFILAALSLNCEALVITKKGAIDGVKKFSQDIEVTNYHQAKNVTKKYKVVILDECHRYITAYPKRSPIWIAVAKITYQADYVIFSSGTPTPESFAMLFNMLALSLDSPWRQYKKYTDWHRFYGIPYEKSIGWDDKKEKAIFVKGWDRVKEDKILRDIDHLIVNMTRKEAGHTFEPTDKLHHIPLSRQQECMIKAIENDGLYELANNFTILTDTAGKKLQKRHQISGGFVNAINDLNESETKNIELRHKPKVDYILKNFNPQECIILAFYIPEQEYLKTIFPFVDSITKKSDGVDYSHFKHMILYSWGFSAATYEQVRGRQLNFMTRKEEVIIHFLVSGIDDYVYQAVSNKQNFTTKWYLEKIRSNR